MWIVTGRTETTSTLRCSISHRRHGRLRWVLNRHGKLVGRITSGKGFARLAALWPSSRDESRLAFNIF